MSMNQKIIDLYIRGATISSIAETVGKARSTVRDILKKNGVYRSPKGENPSDALIFQKLEEGVPKAQIARDLGITPSAVKHAINKTSKIADPKGTFNAHHSKRFVITSAMNNCPIHQGFLASLKRYCEHFEAELVVIPVHYKNVSLYTGNYEPWWPEEVKEHFLTEDMTVGEDFTVMGSVRIQATSSKPLSGIGPLAKGRSAVFAHPRVALTTVPTPPGEVAQHHIVGAVVLEVGEEGTFWRHISSNEDGSFTDLDLTFTPKEVTEAPRAACLVLGDVHVGFHDKTTTKAMLGTATQLLNPHHVILHDVLDFFSASHHHANNRVLRVMKSLRGCNDVYRELVQVAEFFDEWVRLGMKYHVIRSNHHDHLAKWLNKPSEQIDVVNQLLWFKLNYKLLEQVVEAADGESWGVVGPFELAMRDMVSEPTLELLNFHSDKDTLMIKGIDVGNHGDRGPNGSRGSISGYAKVKNKTIIGHTHRPGIQDGCYQVGVTCGIEAPYTAGYGSWSPVGCIIYDDGHRTLLPVIGGALRPLN